MTEELEKLIALQKTDTNIRKLKKAIETAEQRRAGIEQEFERHAFEIRGIQGKSDAAKTERADLERQITEAKTSLERANRNLKNAQNQKEYQAAMTEVDILQKQIGTLETQTLEKMTAVEEVEQTLADRADEISSIETDRQKALAEFDHEVEKQKKEFEEATAKRQEVFVTLPTNLARIYDRLAQRSRDGIAVAEVVNGACSACFMKLRPQALVNLRKGDEIITCEECTRILYLEPKDTRTDAAVK